MNGQTMWDNAIAAADMIINIRTTEQLIEDHGGKMNYIFWLALELDKARKRIAELESQQ